MYYTDAETTFEDILSVETPPASCGWKCFIPTTDQAGKVHYVHHVCFGFDTKKQAIAWGKQEIHCIRKLNSRVPKVQQEIILAPVIAFVKD